MNYRKLLYFFISFIVIVSCNKNKENLVEINGIVLNKIDGKPLSNQTILLTEYCFGQKTISKGYANTSENGEFAFYLDEIDKEHWYYKVELIYNENDYTNSWEKIIEAKSFMDLFNDQYVELSLIPITSIVCNISNTNQSKQLALFIENDSTEYFLCGNLTEESKTIKISKYHPIGKYILSQEVTDSTDNLIITKYDFELKHKEVKELTIVY